MGLFLSISGVIGRQEPEVQASLAKFASLHGGKIKEESLTTNDHQCCVIHSNSKNTSILYPSTYVSADETSAFLSKDLDAPVFSLHIHDGELWMYTLYVGGEIVDQFNPIPDYWEPNIGKQEVSRWQGNAVVVAGYLPELSAEQIQKYLVRWDPENQAKAYDDDEFGNEAWQLSDFMAKCGLPYPLDDAGTPRGKTYRLTVNESKIIGTRKWWKFWS